MARADIPLLTRLGPVGLARVLDDVLEGTRLIKLANGCGLKYPGMRTQSQKRQRIVTDLVDRAKSPEIQREIQRQLSKEARPSIREWRKLTAAQRNSRVAALNGNGSGGALGRHLLLLALDGEASKEALTRLRTELEDRPAAPPGDDTPGTSALERRHERKTRSLQRKLDRLETQLEAAREENRQLKGDLMKRKGELAESRMLVERLRRQVARTEESARKAGADTEKPDWEGWARAMRRMANEHKKLSHHVEKAGAVVERVDQRDQDTVDAGKALQELRRELAGLRRDQRRESQAHAGAVEGLTAELAQLRKRVAPRPAPAKRAAPTSPRVGVFIDVQNVYYGARRLKGKLDFETLMEAAVQDRRLIQSTAYVVESKEIDQSSFIAVLEKRGITVRRKALRVRADGSMKGDWDMELALDILDAARKLDVVVLVSGDGDFTSLVHRVKQLGPRCEVFAFPRNTAKSLQEAADRYQPLDRRFMIYPSRTETSARGDRSEAADTPS